MPGDGYDREGQRETRATALRYASLGAELAFAIIGLTLAGLWIDQRFGTEPKGLVIGATIGVVGGMYNFIRQALNLMKSSPRATEKNERDANSHHDHDRWA